jgi:hypothetical protein
VIIQGPRLARTPADGRPLALLAVADFVVVLDATIVKVALPSIGGSLHASTSELSWVIGSGRALYRGCRSSTCRSPWVLRHSLLS